MTFINALVAILAFCVATSSAERLVFNGPSAIPSTWQMSSFRLADTHTVSFKIALVPKDGNRLESELLQIATPGNPRFRKYLTQSQITEIVGRSDEEIARVSAWLATEGMTVESVHPHRDWITVSAKVNQIEKLLDCKLAQFTNEKLGQTKIGKPRPPPPPPPPPLRLPVPLCPCIPAP